MIAVSAGHHPAAKGAHWGLFNEHDEAVIWANYLVDYLGDFAILVPVGVLRSKISFINSRPDVTLAIEIHFNSAVKDGEHIGDGSETLYYPGSSNGKRAAITVQEAIGRVFQPDRGVKEGYYQMNKEKGPDFFLAKTRCTALIVEPQFIQNEKEIKSNRQIACQAMASALLELMQE